MGRGEAKGCEESEGGAAWQEVPRGTETTGAGAADGVSEGRPRRCGERPERCGERGRALSGCEAAEPGEVRGAVESRGEGEGACAAEVVPRGTETILDGLPGSPSYMPPAALLGFDGRPPWDERSTPRREPPRGAEAAARRPAIGATPSGACAMPPAPPLLRPTLRVA